MKGVLVCLLVLGMTANSIIPKGWMIEGTNADGGLVVSLCGSGMHERFARLNLSTGEWTEVSSDEEMGADEEPTPADNSLCDFIANQVVDASDTPIVFETYLFGPPRLGNQLYLEDLKPSSIAPPLPARGPPVIV